MVSTTFTPAMGFTMSAHGQAHTRICGRLVVAAIPIPTLRTVSERTQTTRTCVDFPFRGHVGIARSVHVKIEEQFGRRLNDSKNHLR